MSPLAAAWERYRLAGLACQAAKREWDAADSALTALEDATPEQER